MALAAFTFMSCDDYETYGEKKEKERDAIAAYIAENNIKVIDEATFTANGEKTSVENNEYVYLEKSGIYMQIERRGAGEKLEENKQVNILCRFAEYNINDSYYQAGNMNTNTSPDKFTVQRIGSTITASFIQGVMQSYYGNSVPEVEHVLVLECGVGAESISVLVAVFGEGRHCGIGIGVAEHQAHQRPFGCYPDVSVVIVVYGKHFVSVDAVFPVHGNKAVVFLVEFQ